jgi:hypothetical protein
MTGPSRRSTRGPLRTALLFVGALLFLFEEWLWTRLTCFFAWLGRLGALRWLDARLVRLPPMMALVILCLPMVLLFPFKVAGLWMIASGRFLSGCLLMLAAKVLSTATIARIFLTCRPQLMRMAWFARLHAWTVVLRDRIHAWIAEQQAWRQARRVVRLTKAQLRSWTGRGNPGRRGPLFRWRSRRKARRAHGMTTTVVVRPRDTRRR